MAETPVDVVLLDLLMPVLDGYATLERLPADDGLRHIPVIVITAVEELDSVVRCIELGATDYLPKPFDAAIMRARRMPIGPGSGADPLLCSVLAPRPTRERSRVRRALSQFRGARAKCVVAVPLRAVLAVRQRPHPRRHSRVLSARAVSMRVGSVIRALHHLAGRVDSVVMAVPFCLGGQERMDRGPVCGGVG